MNFLLFKRLLVFEETLPLHDYHYGLFGDSGVFDDFRIVGNENEFLEYTTPRSIPIRTKLKKVLDLVVVLCTKAYLSFMKKYDFVRELIPDSRIVLHDESPKQGCIYIADSLCLHGCSTYRDEREDVLECISRIAEGSPAVTPCVAHLLHADESRGIVQGKTEYKDCEECKISGLYDLKPREWACFRHLAAEGTIEKFAELEGLTVSYSKKIMYEMLGKLKIGSFAQLKRMATAWGFVA